MLIAGLACLLRKALAFFARKKKCVPIAVQVPFQICEIKKAVRYSGKLLIGKGEFTFDVVFAVPIHEWAEKPMNMEEARQFVQIVLKKGEEVLSLDDAEFKFFASILANFAQGYYSTLDMVGQLLGAEPMMGMQTNTCHICSCTCRMLSSEKFGCNLISDLPTEH